MNARNLLYIKPYNPRSAIALADDKIKAKAFLSARGIPSWRACSPISHEQLLSFDFPSYLISACSSQTSVSVAKASRCLRAAKMVILSKEKSSERSRTTRTHRENTGRRILGERQKKILRSLSSYLSSLTKDLHRFDRPAFRHRFVVFNRCQ